MGSQVVADEGCEREVVHIMNEGYIERGAEQLRTGNNNQEVSI